MTFVELMSGVMWSAALGVAYGLLRDAGDDRIELLSSLILGALAGIGGISGSWRLANRLEKQMGFDEKGVTDWSRRQEWQFTCIEMSKLVCIFLFTFGTCWIVNTIIHFISTGYSRI